MARSRRAKTPRSLPQKERFYVSELAEYIAALERANPKTVQNRIYRAVDSGRINAVRVLGVMAIPYAEARRVYEGDPVW